MKIIAIFIFMLNITSSLFIDSIKRENGVNLYPYFVLKGKQLKLPYKYGFINEKGEIAIKAKYDDVLDFSEDYAGIKKDDKWGFIDKSNMIIIEPEFEKIRIFSEGLAAVMKTRKWGFINKIGKLIIDYQFSDIKSDFKEGYSIVSIEENPNYVIFINKQGKNEFLSKYEGANSFSEGLAAVKYNNKWGYIDHRGIFVIDPQYQHVTNYAEGLAVVKNKFGNTIYIDKKGELAFNIGINAGHEFSEGLAAININMKWGYIDKTGKIIIEPQFDRVESFSDGLAAFLDETMLWGFIDKKGKKMIEPIFTNPGKYCGGIAKMKYYIGVGAPLEWEYIDKKGKIIWRPDD